jgi:hypothetical protein
LFTGSASSFGGFNAMGLESLTYVKIVYRVGFLVRRLQRNGARKPDLREIDYRGAVCKKVAGWAK